MTRDFGFYPASIGTSLALEGLNSTGENVGVNKGFKLERYGALYVNMRTIVRNAIGSFPYEDQRSLSYKQIRDAAEQDYDCLTKHVPEHLQIIPYICTFQSLNKEFKGKHKQYNTDLQKLAVEIEEGAVFGIYKENEADISRFDIEMKGDRRTICLTHHPIDLLSAKKFPELILLESHTGKLKDKEEWSTKLRTCANPSRMPFNKVTLQMYADNNMFMPQPKKMRDVMMKIGEKREWDASTKQSTMLLDVRNSYEPHLYKHLLTLE
ncbi:MAG: hypothetical protein ACRDDY_13950 [Clostridium sp.]|uniref:hypothetical protein n=1 Tax=Clostridium sp. TaxID=1506 RepID=UPI003EE4AEA7